MFGFFKRIYEYLYNIYVILVLGLLILNFYFEKFIYVLGFGVEQEKFFRINFENLFQKNKVMLYIFYILV